MSKKYIESLDEMSKLSQRIVKRHPWGYQGFGVRGGRGEGKTSFGLHTGREVYQYIDGISRTDAFEKLLGVGNYRHQSPCILFDLSDVIKALEPLDSIDFVNILDWQRENTVPYMLWDDAGMHGGKYKFFTDVKLVEALQGEVDTIRFILTGFGTTSPEIGSLLKFLQDYKDNLIISIKYNPEGQSKYSRVAEVKKYYEHRNGNYRKRLAWTTKFSCYVDKWAYAEYSRMKARAIIRNRARMKKMLKVAEEMGHDKEEVAEEMGVPLS